MVYYENSDYKKKNLECLQYYKKVGFKTENAIRSKEDFLNNTSTNPLEKYYNYKQWHLTIKTKNT